MSSRQHLSQRILIDLIDVGERIRPVDPLKSQAIGDSMADVGQHQPILVRVAGERFSLVDGAHRLDGAKRIGWSEIEAKIVDFDDLQAEQAEIETTLIRAESIALDRALMLARLKEIHEQLYPETKRGGDRKSSKFQGENQTAKMAVRFLTEAAEALDISERSIMRSCQIVDGLSPEIIQDVRSTYIADHQAELLKLAQMPAPEQARKLRRIVSGEVKRLADCDERPEIDAQEELLRKFLDLWARAGAKTKRRMLRHADVSPEEIERVVNPRKGKAH